MKKLLSLLLLFTVISCNENPDKMDDLLNKYTSFTLTTDVDKLSENDRKMLPLLIEAADEMDKVFWLQAYGDKTQLLDELDEKTRRFAEINYGPWDRLDGNKSFVDGVGEKPLGANFYPIDMTKEEFDNWDDTNKKGLYDLVRRDDAGDLYTLPYNEAFREYHSKAASKLREAAQYADDEGLKKYLELRADALESNNYRESELAWMDMKNNVLDIIIGPIENYEDQLFGYKTANESYVLVKDVEWSERLAKYASILPELQEGLPVDDKYKTEKPGSDSDLNAYDVVYYAGDSNSGSKTIAINLPNDEEVQLQKGTRRLQLKNSMQAKYDKILVPIAEKLIDKEQQEYITFDAFFGNTMFHEVAHGLGIKNTITGNGTVRSALQNHASAIEEGKADVLGLYMVQSLFDRNMMDEGQIEDNYVTFLASIFRSVRFGSSSAHGRANLIRYNYFKEKEAFSYDESTKRFSINFENVNDAVKALSEKIIVLQGNGDYDEVNRFVEKYTVIPQELENSLESLTKENIPVDIIFEQGVEVLGL